jgi:hypothetical protein
MLGFLVVAWCLCAAAEVAASGFDEQRLWFVVRDALTLPGVILGLWFALEYAGLERWLTRPVTAALTVMVILRTRVRRRRRRSGAASCDGRSRATPLDRVRAFAIAMFLLATAVFLILHPLAGASRAGRADLVGRWRCASSIRCRLTSRVPNIVACPRLRLHRRHVRDRTLPLPTLRPRADRATDDPDADAGRLAGADEGDDRHVTGAALRSAAA